MRSLKTLILAAALAFGVAGAAQANEGAELPQQAWPHAGPFGKLDKAAARRGFQVFNEICKNCHSLSLASFRNLQGIGFTEDQVKEVAAAYEVDAPPNDEGKIVKRKAIPSDRFVKPFDNDNAARAANAGALPPDLSVIIKARHDGENYVTALLTGYEDAPAGFTVPEGKYYNKYFPGHTVGMPQMLFDDSVTYTEKDAPKATALQEAKDVSTFLSYIAEPSQDERKSLGVKVILFLLVFSGLMFACKRTLWADVGH